MFENVECVGGATTISLNSFRFAGQRYTVITSDITHLQHIQYGFDREAGYQGILGNYETMLFIGEDEQNIFPDNPFPELPGHPKLGYFARYETEDEARDGHQAFVTKLQQLLAAKSDRN